MAHITETPGRIAQIGRLEADRRYLIIHGPSAVRIRHAPKKQDKDRVPHTASHYELIYEYPKKHLGISGSDRERRGAEVCGPRAGEIRSLQQRAGIPIEDQLARATRSNLQESGRDKGTAD